VLTKNYQEKINRRLVKYKKRASMVFRRSCNHTAPIFILGYGRSGTSMMLNVFASDMNFEIFRENDSRIAKNYMLDYKKIKPVIDSCKFEFLVMKPILNSFDAKKLLDSYDRSKILWMIRGYRDVTASAIKKWGSNNSDSLRELVLENKDCGWLSKGMPAETLEILRNINTAHFSKYDWQCLVWWSVNRMILLNNLYLNNNIFLLKYETLIENPEDILKKVYQFAGLAYQTKAHKYIFSTSVKKGSSIELRPVVQKMCDSLIGEIIQVCK